MLPSMASMIHDNAVKRASEPPRWMPTLKAPAWEAQARGPAPDCRVNPGFVQDPVAARAADLFNAYVADCRDAGEGLCGDDLEALQVASVTTARLESRMGLL